jgi:hypothetical protein
MACAQYYHVGWEDLKSWYRILGTNIKTSTNPHRVIEVLFSLGLCTDARKDLNLTDLTICWAKGWPVICMVDEYGIPDKEASYNYGHCVVSIGVEFGYVFVNDPSIDNVLQGKDCLHAKGVDMIDEHTWMERWHTTDEQGEKYPQFGIIVKPPSMEYNYGHGQPHSPLAQGA